MSREVDSYAKLVKSQKARKNDVLGELIKLFTDVANGTPQWESFSRDHYIFQLFGVYMDGSYAGKHWRGSVNVSHLSTIKNLTIALRSILLVLPNGGFLKCCEVNMGAFSVARKLMSV